MEVKELLRTSAICALLVLGPTFVSAHNVNHAPGPPNRPVDAPHAGDNGNGIEDHRCTSAYCGGGDDGDPDPVPTPDPEIPSVNSGGDSFTGEVLCGGWDADLLLPASPAVMAEVMEAFADAETRNKWPVVTVVKAHVTGLVYLGEEVPTHDYLGKVPGFERGLICVKPRDKKEVIKYFNFN